jgi:hypothetical protein
LGTEGEQIHPTPGLSVSVPGRPGEFEHGARGIELTLLNPIALQVSTVVTAGLEPEPLKLSGHVLRHLLELRTRRGRPNIESSARTPIRCRMSPGVMELTARRIDPEGLCREHAREQGEPPQTENVDTGTPDAVWGCWSITGMPRGKS